MKYIGKFSDYNIPISQDEYGTLFCYVEDTIEIRIYYKREFPYFVEYIAILIALTDTYSTFQLYEYCYTSEYIDDVKRHVADMVEQKIDEIRQHSNH